MPKISAVIPVYGCADCLGALHDRLVAALEQVSPDWEIIYVDDRSPDHAWDKLVELSGGDPRVWAYRLSRNFGQHAAITAGLAHSRGDWVTVLDCDLQDPPEEIPRLFARAREGYEVVLSKRSARAQSRLRAFATRAYFRLRNIFFRTDMDTEYSTLSVLSRKVVDAFLSIRDRDRQYMLILHWLGFEHAVVEITHGERHSGRSSYTFRRMVAVALDGMFFQTTVLLRWIVYVGFAVAFLGALVAGWTIYSYFQSDPLPGWTSLVVVVLVIGGFIIISTGVSALYVGKIFEQVKERPLFVVDRIANAGRDAPPRQAGREQGVTPESLTSG
jgi:dolichol-phosphate mannosyltransferase